MDTNGVRLFVLAADMLNITAAGKRLGLAPSVASARLAKLEVQLGADLFHRSTRKITLSIEGAEFLPFAREIIAQEDAALVALGKGSAKVNGTLRFAASSTFAQLFVAPILPEFFERYPDVKVELKLTDTQVSLIDGGFDLALRNYTAEDTSLIGRKLANDTRILCASPDYLTKYGTPQNVEQLNQHQLIVFNNARPRKLVSNMSSNVHYFPPASVKPQIIVDDGASMREATKAGAGICMSSIWNVYKELKAGSIVQVLPEYKLDDQAAIWLVYPKSNVLTAKVRVFIDYLIEKIGEPPVWETNTMVNLKKPMVN
ncbi:LysR family transcriptional regulator [Catenovulum agarivorans DS-2]|uniref:LysR family transcriptional regulator n=1 Tax=Catenovulum agarivorans DS-2 TaxID=1328313 RepID=W7QBK5_9ALTE|nr:LysR family transcriptional regulator [Catenovulum agarivorans]EWH10199.1 LysR family transcriptional regulator [Catenovulum agarivorans DS-2]